MDVSVYLYESFTTTPQKGNPAGVVLDSSGLSDTRMLRIAERVGFNETVFVLPSKSASVRMRYFTPGHEINLCGHATMAACAALVDSGGWPRSEAVSDFTLETNAGILRIRLDATGELPYITMQQAAPEFAAFDGSVELLARALGLNTTDIDPGLPILYGSTGTWTLIVPIRGLGAFSRMTPDNAAFPTTLRAMPRASVHPFCLETHDPAAQIHARHFSSPYSGTVEDAVTGTASGVLGAYYDQYIRIGRPQDEVLTLVVEQGQEIGRDGRVSVTVEGAASALDVSIGGTAVFLDLVTVAC